MAEVRLNNIAQLDTVFDRASSGTNRGAWIADSSGSTASSDTGPGTNSSGPYVYSETSGASNSDTRTNSVLTVKSSAMTGWTGNGRTLNFRACIAGDFGDTGEGLRIEGRVLSSDSWTTIETVEGWAYSNTYTTNDTITDENSDTLTCAQDGGWVDFSVTIPDNYTQVRLFNNAIAGTYYKHDIALWSVNLVDGTASGPTAPSIPDQSATQNSSFSFTVPSASSGNTPITVSTSTLPAGLSLSGYVISGIPTVPGTTSVTVTYTDSNSDTATASFDILVVSDLMPTAPSIADQTVIQNSSFSFTIPLLWVVISRLI